MLLDLPNPLQGKVEKVFVDLPYICKGLTMKIRILLYNADLKPNPYKRTVPQAVKVESYPSGDYLRSTIGMDFPVTLSDKDNKVTLYLGIKEIELLKENLKRLKEGFPTKGLFYYLNQQLMLDQEKAKEFLERMPMRGNIVDIGYTVVADIKEEDTEEPPVLYEGIGLFDEKTGIMVSMTIDEMNAFMLLLSQINYPSLYMQATQLAYQMSVEDINVFTRLRV